MNDEQRNLARSARTVQNLQLWLLLGMIVGAVAGFLAGTYVVMPMLGSTSAAGFLGVIVATILGGFIGQRTVLSVAAR